MFVDMNRVDFEKEIVNSIGFRLAYFPCLDRCLMICSVPWIATYDRYYAISKKDFMMYSDNRELFFLKYKDEILQNDNTCFTKNFIGSAALRDYDGKNDFHKLLSTPENLVNPFQHYRMVDDVLFARLVCEDGEIYVPPFQKIKHNNEYIFPLRNKCELHYDKDGNPICYKLKNTNNRSHN